MVVNSTIKAIKSKLLDTLPEVIINNPYRQLGLDLSATPSAIRRACEDMLAALLINRLKNGVDYLAFLPPLIFSKETIEHARHVLQDPAQRVLHSFFWLAFGYPQYEQVRASLTQGNLDEAIFRLESVTTEAVEQEYQNAIHDYGLLVFIAAQMASNTRTACQLYSKCVGILIASSRMYFESHKDQQAAVEIIVTSIARRSQLAIGNKKYADACKFLKLCNDLPFDDIIYTEIATRPFRQFLRLVIQRCNSLHEELNAITDSTHRPEIDQLSNKFIVDILTPVKSITTNCQSSLDGVQETCDNIFDCGHTLSIILHNQFKDSQAAYDLIRQLVKLPISIAKEKSSKDDLAILSRHVSYNLVEHYMKIREWNAALKALEDISLRCVDKDERMYIERQKKICRQAIEIISEKQKLPSNEHIWDRYVGSQIRRSILNALWVNIVTIIGCLIAGPVLTLFILKEYADKEKYIMLILLSFVFIWAVNNLCILFRQYRHFEKHPISRKLTEYGPLEWVVHSIDSDIN